MLRGIERRIAETDGELLLKIQDGTAAARLQVLIVEIMLLLNDLFSEPTYRGQCSRSIDINTVSPRPPPSPAARWRSQTNRKRASPY